MAVSTRQPPRTSSEEILTRQRLVGVALAQQEADLVLEDATLLNVQTLTWKENWDVVIKGQRIAWVGPHGEWKGSARTKVSVRGVWAVPGFGEAHKHIESTMLSPEYEADLVLRFGTTWNVEASHEFSNVNGARNVEFWLIAREHGSPFKIFPSLGSATPPTGWEESGGYYGYREIRNFMDGNLWVTGLDEVMDWSAVVNPDNPGYRRLWENIEATLEARGVVEGHGTGLESAGEISAFAAAGISSDHEIREGQEAWDKLERGIFLEVRPNAKHILKYLVEKGLRDWSSVAVTTDDRNAETTLRRGAMDHNIRSAIESGVPLEIAYGLGSYNTARHFRIDHLVGSLTPGRYADIVLLSDPAQVKIKAVYADGMKVSEDYKMLVPVPEIIWPEWATKTVNLGRKIEASDFAVPAPAGRTTMQAAVVPPFHYENDFFTVELPVKDGFVQRDETRAITKVALLDRYSGRTRVSRMFWKDVGMKTPNSAMCCSIVHDNHNTWAVGSSDEAMAMAVNAMAEMELGDRTGVAWSMNYQGDVARDQGDSAAARTLYEQGLGIFRELGDRWGIAGTLADLGSLAGEQGNYPSACSLYRESIKIFQELDHKRGIARLLESFACAAAVQLEAERAMRLAGAAAALRQNIGAPLTSAEQTKLDASLHRAWQALGKTFGVTAWSEGWALPVEKAIEEVLMPEGASPAC